VTEVSRSLAGASSGPVRLAVSTLDETVGVVVEGEPAPDRRVSSRWVIPVHLDSGQTDAPEPLGASDFSDRASVPVCNDSGAAGWTFDAGWPSARVQVTLAATDEVWTLRQVFARFRVTSDRACVERLVGSTGERTPARAAGRPEKALPGGASEPVLPLVAITDALHPLQCTALRP
jgi:hypothetical protein